MYHYWRSATSQRIRCKPISPCKLYKFQSESLDQHRRGTGDWIILQSGPPLGLDNHIFANPPSHFSASFPLDVDLMVQIEIFIVCTKKLICTKKLVCTYSRYVPVQLTPLTFIPLKTATIHMLPLIS